MFATGNVKRIEKRKGLAEEEWREQDLKEDKQIDVQKAERTEVQPSYIFFYLWAFRGTSTGQPQKIPCVSPARDPHRFGGFATGNPKTKA